MKNRENTDGVAEKIEVLVEKVPGIQYAFIYGSYGKNPKKQESDVDLMVVGDRIWLKWMRSSQEPYET